ncbi:MAG: hypothetical protein ACYC9R_12720 [Nitrosotalea sp.]
MATRTSVSLTSAATSTSIPVNYNAIGNIPMGLVVDFTTGTGVGTASVEFTFDDPSSATAVWFAFTNLTAKTATAYDNPTMPCRAVRLHVTAYTSGTITLRILQGDNIGE